MYRRGMNGLEASATRAQNDLSKPDITKTQTGPCVRHLLLLTTADTNQSTLFHSRSLHWTRS